MLYLLNIKVGGKGTKFWEETLKKSGRFKHIGELSDHFIGTT